MNQSVSDHPAPKQRWLFYIALACLVLWTLGWLHWYELDHDEVEHLHAAWLMHNGEQPFEDFFEHHSPLFWNLLRLGYAITGDSFAIITLTRAWTILIFLLTLWVAYKIARHWLGHEGAWIAALGFPMFTYGLLVAHVQVRGDPIILLLLMFSLRLAVLLADRNGWLKADVRRFLLMSACLGLAVVISPRAGLASLTVYVVLFVFSLRSFSFTRAVVLFLLGGLIVLLPTVIMAWIYGFETYFFWVFIYSSNLWPPISPLVNILRVVRGALPLIILVGFSVFYILSDAKIRQLRSIWLVVVLAFVSFFGLWASTRPHMQHFLVTVPFFGFLAGLGYEGLIARLRRKYKIAGWNWAGILLILGVLMPYGKSIWLASSGRLESRQAWEQRAEWILDHTEDEDTFAAGMAYHQPIFMKDAFYHWWPGRYAFDMIERLQMDFQPYTFEDLRAVRPKVLHVSFAEAWRFEGFPEYLEWLKSNYEPTPYRGYWMRKAAAGP